MKKSKKLIKVGTVSSGSSSMEEEGRETELWRRRRRLMWKCDFIKLKWMNIIIN